MRALITMGLAGAMLSGCFSRQIVAIEDGPTSGAAQTTLLTTVEIRNYLLFGVTKRVFWECGQAGAALSCEQVCDVKNDEGDRLMCPTFAGGVL